MSTVFFRLLSFEDKAAALAEGVEAVRTGRPADGLVYEVDPPSFRQVPGSPFAYWVSERIRRLFTELPPFEGEGRTVKQGLATADDFRFVRAWWEVPPEKILTGTPETTPEEFRRMTFEGKRWAPFAKGGAYSPYYADIHLVVNWERDGEEIRAFVDPETGRPFSRPQNTEYYFRPGLTWPRRSTSGFGIYRMPAGAIFADKGPAIFMPRQQLFTGLGILFSKPYQTIIEVSLAAGEETQSGTAARSYEVGIIQKCPWIEPIPEARFSIGAAAQRIIEAIRDWDTTDETTRVSSWGESLPCDSLRANAGLIQRGRESVQCELLELAAKIESLVADVLGVGTAEAESTFGQGAAFLCRLPSKELGSDFDDAYRQRLQGLIQDELEESGGDRQIAVKSFHVSRHLEVLSRTFSVNPSDVARTAAERNLLPASLLEGHAARTISHAVGCVFGRWDVRFATRERQLPDLPDPFVPLPACSPGMLTGADGLPLHQAPTGYPLRIDWDGILVDDPEHPDDIVRRVRDVLDLIWKDRAEAIEKEACEILGIHDLRDYFRKPGNGGFWLDHVRRYSKSRRKAPIYWLLQSSRRNYALWLYYHRLDKDMLFKALVNYVEPKIRLEENRLQQLSTRRQAAGVAGRAAKELEKQLDRQEGFLSELRDFHGRLRRAADLNLDPDLNDGVILTMAPLWELIPWSEPRQYWEALLSGKYVWSTIAKQLRPT